MNNLNTKEKNFFSALRGYDKLGIFSLDTELVCTEWNAGMTKLTGIEEADILGQNILIRFPELIATTHYSNIQAALKNEQLQKESMSIFPFVPNQQTNFTISYLPIFNDEQTIEGCLILIVEEIGSVIKQDHEKIQLRHETLGENYGAGIWQINPEGYTEYVNPAMCELLGITDIEELKGKTYDHFFTAESLERIQQQIGKRKLNISSTYEAELLRPDGKIKNIIINGTPLFSKEGKLKAIIGTFLDLSHKKNAEIELKKSEERFRKFFEKTLTPTSISRNGTLLHVNDAWVKLFNYNLPEDFVGRYVTDFIDEKDHDKVLSNIKARAEGHDAPRLYELTGVKKDQTRFLFELAVTRIELPDGMATIVAAKDISAQRAAELAMMESESKFLGIFKSGMLGIAFSNSDWKILETNQKFLNIIQYSKEEIYSMDWRTITPPEYLERDERAVQEYMEKGYISPYEKEYIRKDGKRVHVLLAAASLGEQPRGVSFMIDITDLKESQKEATKIAHELTTFMYMASHDLKGPLASVIGLTNIAHNDVEDMKSLEYLKLIQECTLKLDRSLMNFLKIIRIKNNPVERSLIDFNLLAEEIISSLKHLSSSSTIDFKFSNRTASGFYSDLDMLHSIIENLVENSIKYHTRLRSPKVIIDISETQENLVVVVDDNGRGIDPQIKDRIFDMFYRGDISSKGSGLGLYIVKSAVEKLQGSVQFQNKPEGGSRFTVTLPKQPI